MTLPSYPTLFLAHCKAHKADTQKPTLQRLKMPTHSPPTPADVTRSNNRTSSQHLIQYQLLNDFH